MKPTEAQRHLLALLSCLDSMEKHMSPMALEILREHYTRARDYLRRVGVKP